MESIEARVKRVLAENLGRDAGEISLDSELESDLGADSMDVIEISISLEEEFAIELTDEDMEGVESVGDLVDVISNKGG